MTRPSARFGWLMPIGLALYASVGAALAHEAQPLLVTLREEPGGALQVSISLPPDTREDNRPSVDVSGGCREAPQGSSFSGAQRLECGGRLEGKSIRIRYPIVRPAALTMIRAVSRNGREWMHVLMPDETSWTVPSDPGAAQVARQYLELGVRHIWSGIDHLLFVSGLLLLAGSWRRAVLSVTGFTIAHSITLALAALGMIAVPVAPTEAAIALSIVFLARELCDARADTLAKRFPMIVACTFGLLHGLGFASALGETGLPRGHVALGLLFFNAGVEAGQIAFVVGVFAAAGVARTMSRRVAGIARWPVPVVAAHRPSLVAYALGMAGAFWFIQRGAALI
jgi:hypothetical protein